MIGAIASCLLQEVGGVGVDRKKVKRESVDGGPGETKGIMRLIRAGLA